MNEHYAAVLADLEQMKADAEDGIRAIKRLMSRSGSVEKRSSAATSIRRENAHEASLPNRITTFLGGHEGKSFKAEDLAKGLGGDINMKTLRGTLARLANAKKIGKHGRGRYKALRSNTPSAETMIPAA